jgi:hypothetical protein
MKAKLTQKANAVQAIQNSNMELGTKDAEACMTRFADRILIQNGSAWAWFYPSKGLNALISRAGKPKITGIKAARLANPENLNPRPHKPHEWQRHTYAEIVKMSAGGDDGKGQDAGRGNGDDHGRADAKGAVNTGSGTGAWNTAHGNGGRHDCNPARSNLGYNPGHTRGPAYQGYARGWQRPPHRGYQYSGSRFHGNVGRGRGDSFAGQATPHANAVSPNSQSAHAEGKDKPFCFRCWKPGHGKLDCVAQLL